MILICVSVMVLVLLGLLRSNIILSYQPQIDAYKEAGEACPTDPKLCPHEQRARAQIPLFIAGAIMIGMLSLGIYLIFFERSQKEIVSALRKQRQIRVNEEKFELILKGMSDEEKKVMKAVKEQDGITQQTLRLRTDLHKSKLSIVLDGLEKKGLISRTTKGKTKQVFMKVKA